MKKGIFYALVIAALMDLFGCAADKPLEKTAFIDHYQSLETSKNNQKLKYYERAGVVWGNYKKVLLEPVRVRLSIQADKNVERAELERLARYFERQIHWYLSKKYVFVNEPAPDVLRVRVAITDADPVKPALNVVSLFMTLMPTDIGAASVEGEVLDSETLTRLFALAERRTGFALNYTRGFTRLSYVKGMMRDWAEEFKEALDFVQKRSRDVTRKRVTIGSG